jgi:hypothetical protein
MIKIMTPLILRELYGDLMQEKTRDTHKKNIKESIARKAMPIMEVFGQWCDFNTSFLDLIQPVVKVLEENPT